MRWPIRNQILVPFAALEIVAVAAISVVAAISAMTQASRDTEARLQQVIDVLQDSSFPYTEAVLNQMRGLSGAEFVAVNKNGGIQAATMDVAGDLKTLQTAQAMQGDALDLSELLSLQVAGQAYLAARTGGRGPNRHVELYVLYPEAAWHASRRDALLTPLAVGGLTLLAMIAASAWLAARMGGRMRTIQNQVARVAAGDFQPLQPRDRDDEIKDLADSVNRMCAGLKNMASAIREQERAELVTQLAGGLAHQLRNAITGARMAVQLHRQRCATGERESLDVALKQLTLTEEQIKGLLRLTRNHRQPPTPGRLQDAIDDVCAMVRPLCVHQSVKFETGGDHVSATIADVDVVRAALLNLSLNAIEAAGPTGCVDLVVNEEVPFVAIDVRDDGAGVNPEVAESLFDPFVTTKPEGVGLGLALAQQAAREHDGTLTCQRIEDRTVFTLRIRTQAEKSPADSAERHLVSAAAAESIEEQNA
jgi:signal transduction histidine kinase